MGIEAKISEAIEQIVARVFRKDVADIAANHNLRLKEDLGANSKHYFPIISYFEENFDLQIDYHVFQFSATTIQSAIDYIVNEYNIQKG